MPLSTADAILLTSHLRFAIKGGTISASIAITALSITSNVATFTTDGAHGLYVGASVTVAGYVTATYANATYTVVSCPTTTTFTVALTHANATVSETTATVAQSGTVSASVKPIATASNFRNYGDVDEDPEIDPGAEALLERIVPNLGGLARAVRPPRFAKPMVKFKLSQFNDAIVALAFAAIPPASGATQFNPQSGAAAVEGWLKGMHLDEDNTNRIVYDLWGCLRLTSPFKPGSRDFSRPELTFELSFNTLNTVYAA